MTVLKQMGSPPRVWAATIDWNPLLVQERLSTSGISSLALPGSIFLTDLLFTILRPVQIQWPDLGEVEWMV